MADNYRVTGQQEMIVPNEGGMPQRVMEVAFETVPSAVRSYVHIPMASYSADAAHEAINALASEIERTHAL